MRLWIIVTLLLFSGCNKQVEKPVEKQPDEQPAVSTPTPTLAPERRIPINPPPGCTWEEIFKATDEKVVCVRSGRGWFWDSACKGRCQ